MTPGLLAAVSGCGALGAVARFWLDDALTTRWPVRFPYAILLINVTGSLLLGVVTGLVLFHGSPDALRVAVGTGFCGGFTTFSATSYSSVRLAREPALAALNAFGTLGLSVLAAATGLALTS